MVEFIHLPEVALVEIMSYLSLKDRSRLASTCHDLNHVFHHPSLWYRADVSLLSSKDSVIMPQKYVTLINNFGSYFQNLTLKVTGFPKQMPPEIQKVIIALGKQCRLEGLTLSVGNLLSKMDRDRGAKVEVNQVLLLIKEAFRLKTLNLLAWPFHRVSQNSDLLKTIRENNKIVSKLENLNLFWVCADENSWCTINPSLPNPEETLITVEKLRNLRSLKLHSSMMSSELIEELAKEVRRPLETLSIIVTYSTLHQNGQLPSISYKAWQKLKQTSINLQVDITVVNRIPYVDLAAFLQPEIPVVAVSFMKYSSCRIMDIQSIGDKYAHSLVKFCDYSHDISEHMDDALIHLVMTCEHLNYLIFCGNLYIKTVPHLAKLRGKDWKYFQIDSKNVTVPQPEYNNNDVLVKNQDGTYEMSAHLQRLAEAEPLELQAMVDIMVQEAREYLDNKWVPINYANKDTLE